MKTCCGTQSRIPPNLTPLYWRGFFVVTRTPVTPTRHRDSGSPVLSENVIRGRFLRGEKHTSSMQLPSAAINAVGGGTALTAVFIEAGNFP
jgi:hypothetical protein